MNYIKHYFTAIKLEFKEFFSRESPLKIPRRLLTSRLCQSIFLFLGSILLCIIHPTTLIIGLTGLGLFIYLHLNKLVHEISLANLQNLQRQEKYSWYTQIDEHVILGAVPIKEKYHRECLSEKADAVLSIIERWELEQPSPFGEAVKLDLPQKIIEVPDFNPPSLSQIEEAMDFIHSHTSQGRTVYVHCKHGKGRSATTVACYLIKNGKTPEEAIAFLTEKRPQVDLSKDMKATLQAYYEKTLA